MKQDIAKHLLEIKAVYLQPNEPFTWSSGMKSPIYCDNRLTLSFPEIRKQIAEGLSELIRNHFPEVEVVAGTATAGIPHAAWVSDQLNLPMCYVRSKAKGHGKGNQIEGQVLENQKVVVIEDLISTGGSAITAVEALREAGCEVLGIVSIFTYGLSAGEEKLAKANVEAKSLCDYNTLLDVAVQEGYVNEQDLTKLKMWRENPASEGWLEN
ncbi:orotate phosphoribosyltransferase [Metabacillus sediminilitoris]|uniref:Orotate phosphoribosyltransferase n=1 Tax=Metabacillus sediminilitoris TaxID=2567941 RepID=A0A4S4C5G1_9BACI|nr:orotate phosphoribosyltransferase [Metabacillus sediminilitoris]QGQ46921.1 orotate phosphoribosyltransferase [Metabacillus sediminilitoris]THF83069.1 orotate phosphoribosyltransferase [Metabacillus sediminilitoris]